jgi:hypothetical protein
MMMSDDARSDFVLAAASAYLIPQLGGLLPRLPLYDTLPYLVRVFVQLGLIGAGLMLVPVIIMRFREQGAAGCDLVAGNSAAIRKGLVIALPIAALGVIRGYSLLGGGSALLGEAAIPLGGNPAVTGFDIQEMIFRISRLVVVSVGAVVFSGFLINRARSAFRPVEISAVEALRTYGMGATGISLVLGLLRVVSGRGPGPAVILGSSLVLAMVVLLADRLVHPGQTATRMGILAPGIATAVLHVLAAGGLFGGGDLLTGLWLASLGGGLMVVAASIAGTKATTMAWVTPVLATLLFRSCIAPVSAGQSMLAACI